MLGDERVVPSVPEALRVAQLLPTGQLAGTTHPCRMQHSDQTDASTTHQCSSHVAAAACTLCGGGASACCCCGGRPSAAARWAEAHSAGGHIRRRSQPSIRRSMRPAMPQRSWVPCPRRLVPLLSVLTLWDGDASPR